MSEDPGIVFTVKELIGRLDGKLDMMMNVLTNKADRTDVAALEHRVVKVEDKVSTLKTAQEVKKEARDDQVSTTRWRITAITAIIGLSIAMGGFIIALVVHK